MTHLRIDFDFGADATVESVQLLGATLTAELGVPVAGPPGTTDYTQLINKPNIPQATSQTPVALGGFLALVGTSSEYARADHKHSIQVASIDATELRSHLNVADGAERNVNADWTATSGDAQIQNKPSTFAPSAHTHAISDVTNLQTTLNGKQASGSYATLVNGTVPSSQLPSYVDDVVEVASIFARPVVGDTGKIYVQLDTNKTYRWGGSAYVEISASPGSTDAVPEGPTNLYHTAARAAAAAPVQSVAGKTGAVTLAKEDVGLGNVSNTAQVTGVTGTAPIASSGGTTPAISISAATTSAAGSMSAADKTKLDGIATSANNYVHPNHTGDVTSAGDGAATIAADAVTNAKLANVTSQTIKGRASASTGDPEDLTAAQVRSILNVADGAEVNVNADWNATTGDAAIQNKPVLHGVGPSFTSINWQAGAHFGGTLSFNTTIAFQNVVVGKTITVGITGYAQWGVNWPSGITWLSGSAPSITDGATTYFRILATSGSTFLGEAFNPMTAQDKTKLDGVAAGAEVNVNADWTASSGDAQILNKPSTFAPSAHTHAISDVTNLQTTLDGKQASGSYAASSHVHAAATTTVAGFLSTTDKTKLDGIATGAEVNVNADWTASSGDAQILNKPSTFAPSAHTHAISDVTNLESTLNAKHGFQPNPDGVVADNVSDILFAGVRIQKYPNQEWIWSENFNGIRFFRAGNTWRLSRYYTDDGYEWYSETATVDAAWPWLATWPSSSVKKYELPRVLPSPLAETATEGTSQHASRADHTHPYPTPAQIGASASTHTHAAATSSQSGFLSPAEKIKISSSLTTAFLDFGFINTFSGSNPYDYSGKMLQSGIPPVVVGGVRYEAIGFKNGYVYWENSDNNQTRQLVFAPKQPFHVGVGSLATLSTYIPYDSIGTATGGTVVQIEGSAETRRVRQTFSVSSNNYAYVIDFPVSGSSSSGPEQLELWTANQVSVSSTLRLLQRVAVLGPTLGFSWQPSIRARSNEPSSGSHRSSFRIIRTEYDSETNDFYAHGLDARADSDLTDSGGRLLLPVWSLSWAGGVSVVRQDAMFALDGPPGSNYALVSRKNFNAKGGLFAWQPKDGRVSFTNTTANSVSSTTFYALDHESHLFFWRTSHASGFATGALTMPSALEAEVGQRVLLTTLNNVTAFTLNANGNTIYGATLPSSLSANQTLEWVCVASATWVRIR